MSVKESGTTGMSLEECAEAIAELNTDSPSERIQSLIRIGCDHLRILQAMADKIQGQVFSLGKRIDRARKLLLDKRKSFR